MKLKFTHNVTSRYRFFNLPLYASTDLRMQVLHAIELFSFYSIISDMLLEVGHKYIKNMFEISTYDARKTKKNV